MPWFSLQNGGNSSISNEEKELHFCNGERGKKEFWDAHSRHSINFSQRMNSFMQGLLNTVGNKSKTLYTHTQRRNFFENLGTFLFMSFSLLKRKLYWTIFYNIPLSFLLHLSPHSDVVFWILVLSITCFVSHYSASHSLRSKKQ